jgi:hypothetical protein
MKREIALETHKMKDGDFKTAYAQASRARVWLGVFGAESSLLN